MGTCPFCDIIAERAPADRVAAFSDCLIFRPLNPVTDGHLLVVPREHVRDASEAPSVTGRVMAAAATYAAAYLDAFNLITSNGASATQTVFHLHVHVVPRRDGDGLTLPWTGQHREDN